MTTALKSFKHTFFLGGPDLEMATIRTLLADQGENFVDHSLKWGAAAEEYVTEISETIASGAVAILIELSGAEKWSAKFPGQVIVIDHHAENAGADQPTSLHQIFELLELPADQWTRDFELVAANDRGHAVALREANATVAEVHNIRQRDRAAQGITAEEEEVGRAALHTARVIADGRAAIVRLPHSRTATVTDANLKEAGGPEYENLLILCPTSTLFFGSGHIIKLLHSKYPNSWYGGNLPDTGYWGHESPAIEETGLVKLLARVTHRCATIVQLSLRRSAGRSDAICDVGEIHFSKQDSYGELLRHGKFHLLSSYRNIGQSGPFV